MSAYAGELGGMEFPHADVVTRYGCLNVDLFFTISGFVVLLSAWDRPPRSFVVSRVVRLYAAYWVPVAATFVFEAGLLPDAADLVLNTQFSHYFIAGMRSA